MMPDVVVIRHPRERIAKCSLRFLHDRPGFRFLRATAGLRYDATGHLLLAVDAEPLSSADGGRPLLLLDSTWRWLPQLERCLYGTPVRRSIPAGIHTAYPRTSRVFTDPPAGLASIEALYLALRLLGHDDRSLLAQYHWQAEFLRRVDAAAPAPPRSGAQSL